MVQLPSGDSKWWRVGKDSAGKTRAITDRRTSAWQSICTVTFVVSPAVTLIPGALPWHVSPPEIDAVSSPDVSGTGAHHLLPDDAPRFPGCRHLTGPA